MPVRGTPTTSTPQTAQHEQKIGVTGVIHQHGVTGLEQAARHQIQPLAGTMRQQHLAGVCRNLVFGQRLRNDHAQGHVAVRQAITIHFGAIAGELAHAAAHRIAKQPVVRQPAAAGL